MSSPPTFFQKNYVHNLLHNFLDWLFYKPCEVIHNI